MVLLVAQLLQSFLFLCTRRPPRATRPYTLFPYTTLFRSRGLEVDKLSAPAVDYQFNSSVGRLVKAAGPLAGKSFNILEIDSFEAGLQNWTPTLPADFARRNGYAILPHLPAPTCPNVLRRQKSDPCRFGFRGPLAHRSETRG